MFSLRMGNFELSESLIFVFQLYDNYNRVLLISVFVSWLSPMRWKRKCSPQSNTAFSSTIFFYDLFKFKVYKVENPASMNKMKENKKNINIRYWHLCSKVQMILALLCLNLENTSMKSIHFSCMMAISELIYVENNTSLTDLQYKFALMRILCSR